MLEQSKDMFEAKFDEVNHILWLFQHENASSNMHH